MVAFCVLAAGLATAAPAHAEHEESVKETLKRDSDQLSRSGTWFRGERGETGDNGFYYTYWPDSYARWDFGNLRGVFRAELFYPGQSAVKWDTCSVPILRRGCKPRPPTASPRIRILQRDDNGREQIIYDRTDSIIKIEDGKRKRKNGWYGWRNNVELNGHIIVEISKRYSDSKHRLAADSFRFIWRDLHPLDKVVAIQACKLDVVNQVLKIERIKRTTKVVLEFARDIAVDAAITAALAALGGPAAIAYKVVSVTNKVRKVEFISKATGAAIDIAQAARRLARAHRNQLPKLLREALDKGKEAEDIIRDGVELGIELVHAVSASLSWDSQRRVDKYLKDCEKSDISIWDDPWDIFIKAGYLDYVQSWHLTPAEPEPQPDPTPAPTPAPTQSPGGAWTVAISLGANNSGSNYCPFSQLACR